MKKLITIHFIICCISCKMKNNELIHNKDVTIHNQNDTILKELYPNKKNKHLVLSKDSLGSNELHLSFYENGNLKEKGLQGSISNKDVNAGMSIETWFYFDSNKKLDSTIYFNNNEFGKDFIEKRRFYKNGNIKSIERYNNYILYENEIDSIGSWKYYDEKGKLLKSINY